VTHPNPDAISLLVCGATGMQGGAVARAARRAGLTVTALVRDPASAAARALAAEGIGLVCGDLEDPTRLADACSGHTTVFSVQPPPGRPDADSERRQGGNLAAAAAKAGVRHLIHTSVSGTGWRARYPQVDAGVQTNYWSSKEDVEATVRSAGPAWTIVKPAFFFDNFVPPKSPWLFPLLSQGELLVACGPDTRVAMLASADFGRIVTTVAADPELFAGAEIELGSDTPTYPEIAETITAVTGRPVTASCRPAAEVDERLGKRSMAHTQVWWGEVGYPARPADAARHGLVLDTTFRAWAEEHRQALIAATTPE
jgi:uncharacterized protein YbjT (DUF2867 family)